MISPTILRDQVRTVYARGACWHDTFARVVTLGLEPWLRQRMVSRLGLHPGATVLDLACGTGLNFAALEAAVGPTGRLIGVDLSPAMLAEAREKVVAHGWRNVTLIVADATTFQLARPVDAVLCTLAIGLMPDPEAVIQAMVTMVRRGGRVLISDARLVERWYGWVVNPLLRWGGRPWLPPVIRERYWTVRPWEALRALTEDFGYEEWLGGALYVAWGRRKETPE